MYVAARRAAKIVYEKVKNNTAVRKKAPQAPAGGEKIWG